MKIISLASQKGGCGKTTIATNLARSLQRRGNQVLIIDCDQQKSATDWSITAPEGQEVPTVIQQQRPTLEKAASKVGTGFDFVVIDGAGQIQKMSVSAVKASDLVLIPVQPSLFDAWAADELISIVKARRDVTGGEPKAAIVMSRSVVGTNAATEMREAMSVHDLPIFDGTHQRVAYSDAVKAGQGVQDYRPGSKSAEEIDRLTDDVLRILSS